MTEDEDNDLEDFTGDYRDNPRWRMENIENLATKRREDSGIIVQHPIREEADEDSDVEYIETMGLSVSSPTPEGVVTVQNTASDTRVAERFIACDVGVIDDLIAALEEAKERYAGKEVFTCPCCTESFDFPEELDKDDYGFTCPECEYLL